MSKKQFVKLVSLRKVHLFSLLVFFSIAGFTRNASAIPDQSPLFLKNSVIPIMMLNMSRDHQLFFKVYDDYSDITDPNGGAPDGLPDRGFVRQYSYYGYFDSGKCYKYSTSNNRFEPSRVTDTSSGNKSYCNYTGGSGEWSGNFLNWASMTRIDAIRKILYGGYRSTDSSTETVLERAFLPHDAHSFAKFYDGVDIDKLTPFTVTELGSTKATGITLCNTTAGSGYSQLSTAAPLIRVAQGNYTLWASNERWQCRWDGAANGNATGSGINAYNTAPASTSTDKLGTGSAAGEYYVRVQVCKYVAGSISPEENCQQYPSASYANKPIGLLQQYGETNQLNFGLMTGTYGKNKSGGVLRKNVGDILDEINTTTYGTFKSAPTTGGIINTLNLLRLFGYNYSDGLYYSSSANSSSDMCNYGQSSFTEGTCSNWGNPQSEIYYESLRYLAGTTATAAFSNSNATTDAGYITGLTQASWNKPLTTSNVCAPLSVLQFNASSNSYDVGSTGYANLSSIGLANSTALDNATNQVGNFELITGTSRFVGMLTSATLGSAPNGNQLCTAKTIDSLSNVSGTCPDSPRLDGGYNMVGLARHARKTGIPITGLNVTKTVRTYGVALAPALPKVEVPLPGSTTGQKVIIQPACRNTSPTPDTNCAIVDFKIVSQSSNATISSTGTSLDGKVGSQGKLYVNWEDTEQGYDYDQDMWGIIEYAITSTKVMVKTQVFYQSTPNVLGFGYVLTGTNDDGFHVHSGINSFTYGTTCTSSNCTCISSGSTGVCTLATARSQIYDVAASSASFLESPLYYAAKWGGYDQAFAEANVSNLDAAIKNRNPSDTYFFATDPKELAKKIKDAFDSIANDVGASASVATSSFYFTAGAYVYQSKFTSQIWNGALEAYKFDKDGNLSSSPDLSTLSTMPKNSSGRKIYTYNGTSLVNFAWSNLTSTQQSLLQISGDPSTTYAQYRVDWLLGNATNENATVGFRNRGSGAARNILGDLVNSSPVYVGGYNYGYSVLPGTVGSTYAKHVSDKKKKAPRIFVGSNDGMLHAFDADTLNELFAYVPNIAFPKLAKLTSADYGKSSNPHQYIVDGPIAIGDVYIGGQWRTILVGTLGGGGRGIYALDITDDTPKVLFELTNTNYSQLGYVLGMPQIVPMVNGRWAVIFGNGDSSSTTSHLFVVDIEAPLNNSYTKVINTGSGTGLSAVELLTDSLGRASKAYAGDLSGNMWRFDLSASILLASNPSASATQVANTWAKDELLFVAKDAANVAQPIFAAPTLGLNQSKNNTIMVYFGTGKYYESGDNIASASPRHSMYAIADIGPNANASLPSVTRATLLKKLLNSPVVKYRVQEANPDWATQNGWYIDFDVTNGERVNITPLLITDKLIFPTLIPSSNPCDRGGSSWLMEVVAVGDKFPGVQVLDEPTEPLPPIYGELGFGVVRNGDGELIIGGLTPRKVEAELDEKIIGRQSWRQLR